jgi:hypothetical protein
LREKYQIVNINGMMIMIKIKNSGFLVNLVDPLFIINFKRGIMDCEISLPLGII